jgi:rod shape-determining protein MreC
MHNLLQLFEKFGGLMMFLFLEGICFYLIVSFNEGHNQIYLSSANSFTGTIYNITADVKNYFKLEKQNEKLLKDNQQLLIEKERLRERLSQQEALLLDSLRQDIPPGDTSGDFRFIGAKVINNSITFSNNKLTLNKGRMDGVVEHAGVINGRGIVGVVRNVSSNYASVMSILHRQTRISASVKGKEYFGTLVWKGGSPKIMKLEAVPKHAELEKGDTIVTSGYTHLFPPNIVIGTIKAKWKEDGNNFYNIDVELVNDMSTLQYAYICIHRNQEELLTLEQEGTNE